MIVANIGKLPACPAPSRSKPASSQAVGGSSSNVVMGARSRRRIHDLGDHVAEIEERNDAFKLTGFDERCDGRPMFTAAV
jgi:hypothetical protein